MSISTSKAITTTEEFGSFVSQIEGQDGYQRPHAFGVGIARVDAQGEKLDTWFPHTNLAENFGSAALLANAVGHLAGTATYRIDRERITAVLDQFEPFNGDGKRHANIDVLRMLKKLADLEFNARKDMRRQFVVSFIGDSNDGVDGLSDAYLRLHLLSHLKVKPNGIGLNGLLGKLRNVAWTNEGPVALEELEARRVDAMLEGRHLVVLAVDKFPSMLDYITPPSNVRITNARNVRLGAYVGEGTTVMTAGSINFNSGTIGPNMVEGRVSAGVVVGSRTDLGGGSSTMGTLSGGGKEKIVIGEGCLIGANAGTGISLGDNCTIEAGLYLTASAKVTDISNGVIVKALTLSGQQDLLFRRNSGTGAIEVIKKKNTVGLNPELHK